MNVSILDGVKFVDVSGTSKGKGTAGVMKRHNQGLHPPTVLMSSSVTAAPSVPLTPVTS